MRPPLRLPLTAAGIIAGMFTFTETAAALPPPRTKGAGERILTATLAPGMVGSGSYSWSQDRREQARHFKFWTHVAVKATMVEASRYVPHVGYVKGKAHKGGWREKSYRERRYLKSMHALKPHEDVEPVEDDHPLVRLFDRPNAWDAAGLPDLIQEWVLFQKLMGNAYWWLIPNLITGLPEELWIIPSQWVYRVGDRNRPDGVKHYDVRPYIGAGDFYIPPDEVIHTREKNPLHKVDGYSTQQAIDNWADELESAHRARFWQFRNQTGLSGAIELPSEYHDPDDRDLERIYAKIFSRLQGESNYGRPAVLGPGMKFVPLKVTPVESDFRGTVEQLRDCILAAWGVPKEVVGVQPSGGDLSWYAPLQQFCRNTIAPLLSYLGHVLTHGVAHRYDPDLRIWWDDPTPDSPDQINKDMQVDASIGVRTVNEFRTIRGLEPSDEPNADKLLIPQGMRPIDQADQEQPAAQHNVNLTGGLPGGGGGGGKPAAPKPKRWRRKSAWHEEDHPRAADGEFGSGGGSGGKKPAGPKVRKPKADDPVHSYLRGFNESGAEPATARDAREANREIKAEGSKWRIVPDGKGGWEAAHVAILVDEYGPGWTVAVNPLTGAVDVGPADFFEEIKALAGDKSVRSTLHAFNDPAQDKATAEDAATANEELEHDGSKYRIRFSEDYGLWVAEPASAPKRFNFGRRKADFTESEHPRDAKGRWAEVGAAMIAAQPHPGPMPPDPPGMGRPDLLAKDPALRAALAAFDEWRDSQHRNTTAHAIQDLLTGRPPKLVPLPPEDAPESRRMSRVARAVEAVKAEASQVIFLGPAFHARQAEVAASHPEGNAALEAARAVAMRDYEAALANALAHIAALPDGPNKDKAERILARQRLDAPAAKALAALNGRAKANGVPS